jgi:uncharacterized cupin superfamily protein
MGGTMEWLPEAGRPLPAGVPEPASLTLGCKCLHVEYGGTVMPKIDLTAVPSVRGTGYPPPFNSACTERLRQRVGNAGGLTDFGVNLMRLPPGFWSSQRHWHSHEDEFVYLLAGELILVEDGGETVLRAGDCAAFPMGSGNGHHMINRSTAMAVYIEIGSRHPEDVTTCSDIDMMSSNADGRFVRKDGTSYDP